MPLPGVKIRRTDSKPAETTCHGFNQNGQHCRRRIKAPSISGSDDDSEESLYCHDHKDQAKGKSQNPVKNTPQKRPQARPPKSSPVTAQKPPRPYVVSVAGHNASRDSLASLSGRLGLMSINDSASPAHQPPRPTGPSAAPYLYGGDAEAGMAHHEKMRKKKKKHSIFMCCFLSCFGDDEDDDYGYDTHGHSYSEPPRPQQSGPPAGRRRPPTELIPHDLPPETIAKLEKEVAKGFSEADEPGYIYIFWLKRDGQQAPDPNAVRSALANGNGNGTTDHYSTDTTLLIKIGRAVNVHKRMREWSSQCKYSIELLRFYPYVPGSDADNLLDPHPTPHANKVENLIHKELKGMGMWAGKEKCENCGTEHQEWFRMEYSNDSIRKVDGVIRKWIEWDRKTSVVMP